MTQLKLFMVLLGCRPAGRKTEQHDIFFGIGGSIKELVAEIKKSWPEAKGNIHIDAWREVTNVDGHQITVEPLKIDAGQAKQQKLFFINLGGYRENEFDEFHYKLLIVAENIETAKSKAKKAAFFKHTTLPKTANAPNAVSHIDDKFGIDVDDVYNIDDILSLEIKAKFMVGISGPDNNMHKDEYHLGYFRFADL